MALDQNITAHQCKLDEKNGKINMKILSFILYGDKALVVTFHTNHLPIDWHLV